MADVEVDRTALVLLDSMNFRFLRYVRDRVAMEIMEQAHTLLKD